MSLNVTIPDTFSGPLDLLLHLIRRDEMDIYDIPMAELTNSYLAEIRKLDCIDVDEGAEFLDLASRLLEIKSRMLLPPDELEEGGEEEEDDFDPRSGLVEALLEYRHFKDAARTLGDMAEEQARRYPRVPPRMDFGQAGSGAAASNPNDLMRAFQNLLDRMLTSISDTPDVITYTEVSIATRIRQVEENLMAVEKTRFSRLLSDAPTRNEMVGFFVAILELVRLGRIVARQAEDFSDIILERRERPVDGRPAFSSARRRPPPVSGFPAAPRRGDKPADAANRPRRPFPAASVPPTRATTPSRRPWIAGAFPPPVPGPARSAAVRRFRRTTQ